jgi:hypothetical protein
VKSASACFRRKKEIKVDVYTGLFPEELKGIIRDYDTIKFNKGGKMPEEKGEEKGFVIKDKRIFSQEDEEKQEDVKEPSKEEIKAKEAASEKSKEAEDQLPEINFPTFIISLNASALVNLGAIEDPASGKKVKNLLLAKQTIDILSMLEEKTRGNLTEDEEKILKNILYDLRIIYVKEKV